MNRSRIARRLGQIARCAGELRGVAGVPWKEFAERPAHFRLAERDVQLIVDSAVDVNNELILHAGGQPPATYYESFVHLGHMRVLPAALARRLAHATGLDQQKGSTSPAIPVDPKSADNPFPDTLQGVSIG
jgi:uncharacterized protein YutE (UPF0331/DUF86 family)